MSSGTTQADFVATNRAQSLARKGALLITFTHGSSRVGSVSRLSRSYYPSYTDYHDQFSG